MLKSNIAACHLKLEAWKAAVDSATAALDALDRLTPKESDNEQKDVDDNGVVEIEATGPEADRELAKLEMDDQRKEDIRRIRAKALMRRARARSEQGGWGNLQGAEEGMFLYRSVPHKAWWLTYTHRLQTTCTNAQPASAGQEDRVRRACFTTLQAQYRQGQGDGRDDGEIEGSAC